MYIRKAKIQHLLKQYKKALETYDAGLKLDPNASELIEGKRQTLQAIRSSSGAPDKARLEEAMKDPEIRVRPAPALAPRLASPSLLVSRPARSPALTFPCAAEHPE